MLNGAVDVCSLLPDSAFRDFLLDIRGRAEFLDVEMFNIRRKK